jgi:solute carrier family 7 (L-type amino acid transporter), member 5
LLPDINQMFKHEMRFLSFFLQTFGSKVFGSFSWLIPIFVALSTFGGVNGVVFTSARLFATGANEGHLPSFFALFHVKRQTPIPSLVFTCILSVGMVLFGNVFELVNYFSQALWLSIAACIFGLLWMRKTKFVEGALKLR